MKDIFDDESNEIITKVFDFVKDNYGRNIVFFKIGTIGIHY